VRGRPRSKDVERSSAQPGRNQLSAQSDGPARSFVRKTELRAGRLRDVAAGAGITSGWAVRLGVATTSLRNPTVTVSRCSRRAATRACVVRRSSFCARFSIRVCRTFVVPGLVFPCGGMRDPRGQTGLSSPGPRGGRRSRGGNARPDSD
jgi:hypothetical protein